MMERAITTKPLIVFDFSLLKRLREHDRTEAMVLYGVSSYEELKALTMETLLTANESFGIYIDGKLEGAFGVSEDNGRYLPWLFGSAKLETINPITFARYSKQITQEWFTKYPLLQNHALADYTVWRWLGWLGFNVSIIRDEVSNPIILEFYYMKGE